MSHYTCSCCGHKEAIFGEGGVQRAAEELGLDVLGQVGCRSQSSAPLWVSGCGAGRQYRLAVQELSDHSCGEAVWPYFAVPLGDLRGSPRHNPLPKPGPARHRDPGAVGRGRAHRGGSSGLFQLPGVHQHSQGCVGQAAGGGQWRRRQRGSGANDNCWMTGCIARGPKRGCESRETPSTATSDGEGGLLDHFFRVTRALAKGVVIALPWFVVA